MAPVQKDNANAEDDVGNVKAKEATPSEAPSFAEIDDKTNQRLLRKIDWKLMPVVGFPPFGLS